MRERSATHTFRHRRRLLRFLHTATIRRCRRYRRSSCLLRSRRCSCRTPLRRRHSNGRLVVVPVTRKSIRIAVCRLLRIGCRSDGELLWIFVVDRALVLKREKRASKR